VSDPFIEALQKSEATLKVLSDDDLVKLALSEVLANDAADPAVPPGIKVKMITLSAELAKRVGVKW